MGPGLDQTTARRRAKELGGIAVSARNPEKINRWVTGGWSKPDDVWIVVAIGRNKVLDDGSMTTTD